MRPLEGTGETKTMNLHAYVSQHIHLSLECYHNAGMTPEKSKEIIESITDPGSAMGKKLICKRSGINRNWNVNTFSIYEKDIENIIYAIEYHLNVEMRKIQGEQNERTTG